MKIFRDVRKLHDHFAKHRTEFPVNIDTPAAYLNLANDIIRSPDSHTIERINNANQRTGVFVTYHPEKNIIVTHDSFIRTCFKPENPSYFVQDISNEVSRVDRNRRTLVEDRLRLYAKTLFDKSPLLDQVPWLGPRAKKILTENPQPKGRANSIATSNHVTKAKPAAKPVPNPKAPRPSKVNQPRAHIALPPPPHPPVVPPHIVQRPPALRPPRFFWTDPLVRIITNFWDGVQELRERGRTPGTHEDFIWEIVAADNNYIAIKNIGHSDADGVPQVLRNYRPSLQKYDPSNIKQHWNIMPQDGRFLLESREKPGRFYAMPYDNNGPIGWAPSDYPSDVSDRKYNIGFWWKWIEISPNRYYLRNVDSGIILGVNNKNIVEGMGYNSITSLLKHYIDSGDKYRADGYLNEALFFYRIGMELWNPNSGYPADVIPNKLSEITKLLNTVQSKLSKAIDVAKELSDLKNINNLKGWEEVVNLLDNSVRIYPNIAHVNNDHSQFINHAYDTYNALTRSYTMYENALEKGKEIAELAPSLSGKAGIAKLKNGEELLASSQKIWPPSRKDLLLSKSLKTIRDRLNHLQMQLANTNGAKLVDGAKKSLMAAVTKTPPSITSMVSQKCLPNSDGKGSSNHLALPSARIQVPLVEAAGILDISTVLLTWKRGTSANLLKNERFYENPVNPHHKFHVTKLNVEHSWEQLEQIDKHHLDLNVHGGCSDWVNGVKHCQGDEVEYVEFLPEQSRQPIWSPLHTLGSTAIRSAVHAALPELAGDLCALYGVVTEKQAEGLKCFLSLLALLILSSNDYSSAFIGITITCCATIFLEKYSKFSTSTIRNMSNAAGFAGQTMSSGNVTTQLVIANSMAQFAGRQIGFWGEKQAVTMLKRQKEKIMSDSKISEALSPNQPRVARK